MSKNKKKLKNEILKILWQNNHFFGHIAIQPLWSFSYVIAYKSSPKNTRKMNLQPNSNNNSPWVHMELEFDMLGVIK
jgi:hypothetical protein